MVIPIDRNILRRFRQVDTAKHNSARMFFYKLDQSAFTGAKVFRELIQAKVTHIIRFFASGHGTANDMAVKSKRHPILRHVGDNEQSIHLDIQTSFFLRFTDSGLGGEFTRLNPAPRQIPQIHVTAVGKQDTSPPIQYNGKRAQ